jgi:hypothetical protein
MPDLSVWPTDGADGSVSSEARWRKMARMWAPSGVKAVGDLAPTLVAGPTINVAIGQCWVDGHFGELTAPASIPASSAGLLVVRFTPADNHCELLYRDAVSTPTQTDPTWELPIALMSGGVLTDVRKIAALGGNQPIPMAMARSTAAVNIPTGAGLTVISFTAANSSEQFDTDGIHNPASNANRWVMTKPGVWRFFGYASWQPTAGILAQIAVRNQAGAVLVSERNNSGIVAMDQTICGQWYTSSYGTDWLELVAGHGNAATQPIGGFQFGIEYVSPLP